MRNFKHVKKKEKKKNQPKIRTKVLVEEGQWGEVAAQAEELSHHHEPVPGANGQRHHQQLGEDERGEGDGDHVHKLRLKQQQGAVHEDATWWRQRKQTHHGWDIMIEEKRIVFDILNL